MTQTTAMLVNAYRELNSRKLFWITMILSGLVVAAFALLGITEKGIWIAGWELDFPLTTDLMSEETFYKLMFVNLGIGFWLAWLAMILALISTASIFPDLIGSATIDLVLSKPIARLRIFLTTYAGGLLFVGLQVAVFSAASFLVLGLRGGAWEPAVFLAVPLVVIFFSYLYCVCALLGLLTRSTIAALLVTLLVWFLIFAVGMAESTILAVQLTTEQKATALEARIGEMDQRMETIQAAEPPEPDRAEQLRERLEQRRAQLADTRDTLETIEFVHGIAYGIKTALPKTTETVGLMERWMVELAELPLPDEGEQAAPASLVTESGAFTPDQERLQVEVTERTRERSVAWVVGTSLIFEAVVLALAALVFQRRDF